MVDIVRAIRKMPLDHLDRNSQKRIISECKKYFWDAPYLFKLEKMCAKRREARNFEKVPLGEVRWTL
jgi:hypothetical protein